MSDVVETNSDKGSVQPQVTVLDSGLRIVTEVVPAVRSIALGFWIEAGSRFESTEQAGYSHLIEHLMFRGTQSFSSAQTDRIFDGIGADVNAATSKEATSLYARFLDHNLPTVCELMSEMVWQPTLDEVESERAVVLEELAMCEDDPQDLVFELLNSVFFDGNALSRPIIGTREVIGAAERTGVLQLHQQRYRPDRVVVAAAGCLDHAEVVQLVSSGLPEFKEMADMPVLDSASSVQKPETFIAKEIEQFHICVGLPGVARDDQARFSLQLLDALLGGNSSSRLFQRIREERGLAYSIFSFSTMYADCGQFGIYLATRGENLLEVFGILSEELRLLISTPIDEQELTRAKESIKGQIALSMESTGARMNRIGSCLLFGMSVLSVDELFSRFDAVTAVEVQTLARKLFNNLPTVVGIGPDRELFENALMQTDGLKVEV